MSAKQIVKTQRSALTRAIAAAAALVPEATELEINQHLDYLVSRSEALEKCTTQLLAVLEQNTAANDLENVLQAEIDKMVEYQEKVDEAKSLLRARLRIRISPTETNNSEPTFAGNGSRSMPTVGECRQNAPVTTGIRTHEFQPEKFDGSDYLKFPAWRSEFGAIIDAHPTLDDTAKFAILRRSLSGHAADLLEGLHCTSSNYRSALELLDSTFGDPNLLLGLFVTKLYDLQHVSSPNSACYAELITKFDANQKGIRQIVSQLNGTVDLVSYFLAPSLLARVPDSVKMHWLGKYHEPEERFDIDALVTFLKNDLRNRKTGSLLKATATSSSEKNQGNLRFGKLDSANQKRRPSQPQKTTTSALVSNQEPRRTIKCIFCNEENHRLHTCKKFEELKLAERVEFAQKRFCCPYCLRHNNRYPCNWKSKCVQCNRDHHVLLCPKYKSESSAMLAQQRKSEPDQNMLQLVKVKMRCSDSKEIEVTALIDSGASSSWIRKDLASELDLPTIEQAPRVVQSLSSNQELDLHRTEVTLCSRESGETLLFRPWMFPGNGWRVYQPKVTDLPAEISRLSTFDAYGDNHIDIDILIGSDIAPRVLTGKSVVGFPMAIESIFGWVLWGPITPPPADEVCLLSSLPPRAEVLWEMEELGIKDAPTVQPVNILPRKIEQRYEICLPFLGDQKPANNQAETLKRQARNELKRNSEMTELYDANIHALLNDKVIEPVSHEPQDEAYYLPHRGIKQKNKLRVVFDASAKTRNRLSLNDCLQTGDNLLLLIPDVLTRFRERRYPCNGDLKAAFHQIAITPEDRRWLRFFHEGNAYQFTRLPFGIKPAPWLLLSTLHAHFDTLDPKLGNRLKNSFYCDDLVCSCDTLDEKEALLAAAQATLATVQMNLRVPESNHVLGMKWDKIDDCLSVDLDHFLEKAPLTKRGLLADFAAIFDPLGILAPYSLVAKQLFQSTWKMNLKWDDPLPPDLVDAWMSWRAAAPSVSIPRWFGGSFSMPIELHAFGDASSIAMGVAIYAVIPAISEVHLVSAKARLLPLKNPPTVPKAELTATLLTTRLVRHLVEVISNVKRVTIWTDSTTTLLDSQSSTPRGLHRQSCRRNQETLEHPA